LQINSNESKSKDSLIKNGSNAGWLVDTLLDFRVVILDEHFFKGLRDKLHASFQSGASVILHEMGRGYGEILGLEMKEMYGKPSLSLILKFMDLGKKHGWGEFHISLLPSALSDLTKSVTIELKNSFFATSAARLNRQNAT